MADGQDVVYKVELDGKQLLSELQKIEKELRNVAKKGDQSFKKTAKTAGLAGGAVGLLVVCVAKLIEGFVELGRQAIRALGSIITQAIELNKEAELTRISLTQIFGGNEAAANAFLEQIKELSIQLGVSRVELGQIGKGILPDVGDVNTTLGLLQNIVILGRDAGQSFDSIRIALEEALSGNLASLQRRLNIPASTIADAEKYAEQFGLADGLAKALQERVERTGLSLEATRDTLAVTAGQLQGVGQDLLQIFGEQFTPELTEQIKNILQSIEENRDDIEAVAKAAGLLVKNVVDFIGTELDDFINNIDFRNIEEGIDNVTRLTNAFRLLFDTLQALSATGIGDILIGLATDDFAQVGVGLVKLATSDVSDVIGEADAALDQFNERVAENQQIINKRREVVESNTEAELEAANAYLQSQKAVEDLADAEEAAAEAKEKIADATENFAKDAANRLIEIQRDQNRQRLEDAIRASEERADIARDNLRDIEDIERDHARRLEDLDTSSKEAEIARENAREQVDIDRDLASNRLRIEEQFQQQLRNIQTRFSQTAQEAERNNDAQAFLAAQRQRDQDIASAEQSRKDDLASAEAQAQDQRDALKVQLEREIEDARIANEQKLADLQKRLERELEDQRIKHQRELEDQTIQEQELAARRARQNAQELDDFARLQIEKKDQLAESLEDEFELVKAAEVAKKDLRIAEAQETADRVQSIFDKVAAFTGGGRSSSSTPVAGRPTGAGIPQFQNGGFARAGQPAIVGEAGPELFVPSTSGFVIPNHAMFSPPAAPPILGGLGSGSQTNNNTFNMTEDIFSNATSRQKLENIVLGVIARSG